MQYTNPAKVVYGDATILIVFRAAVVHTGTFTVGESLTFSGGAAGVVTSYSPGVLSYVIPGDVKPLPGENVDGDVSLVSTALSSLELDNSLINFGIDDGDFLIRSGDHVGYTVGDVPTAWRLELTAPYVGASTAEADIFVHNSRTSLGFFLYDRRDRETASLKNEDNRLLNSILLELGYVP
jgi:hypothetical protein